jgi:hypothetical protein
MTFDELKQIADDRRQWAKEAREKDLHGSAKEWELTASLAEELLEYRELYGALAERGFLAR